MGAHVPTGLEAQTGLRDGTEREGYGGSSFPPVQASLAMGGVVTLCHLGDLGPTAHLAVEEGEVQRCHVTYIRSHCL